MTEQVTFSPLDQEKLRQYAQQTRLASLCEAMANTFIGLVVTLGANYIIFPAYDIHVSFWANIQIVAWFTLLSVVRSYFVRRLWNMHWWRRVFRKA